jgi:para-aminobenzoate synthetase component 1
LRGRNLSQLGVIAQVDVLDKRDSVGAMESLFWMGGKLATGLELITDDIQALREPGSWAVVGSFESNWILAKFTKVETASSLLDFDSGRSWNPIAIENWVSSFSSSEYIEYVESIKNHIAEGDVYQVNACRILQAENFKNLSLLELAKNISRANPAPFASYLSIPGLELASASPERFISLKNRKIISSPIKGTSATQTFLEKDEAENLMIVDLIRNDIGMVAKTGSISTPRLLATEKHPGLFHLVSDIEGELRDDLDVVDLLKATMPPGSVSGAPKSSALRIIKDYEGVRGPYCGAIGWVENGNAELAVGIRTFWQESDSFLKFGTGAGITWGSVPLQEWEETELKAKRLISIAAGQIEGLDENLA